MRNAFWCWTSRKFIPLTILDKNFNPRTNLARKLQSACVSYRMASTQSEPVTLNGKQYRSVREGLASILAPYRDNSIPAGKKPRNNDEGDQAVFYNPIQQFNRDLSVLAILIYGEGAVLEKKARYAKKSHPSKNRKERVKKEKSTATPEVEVPSTDSKAGIMTTESLKRKGGDTQSQETQPAESNAKRSKTDDFEPDDEELEIMALSGQEPAETIQKNGNGPSSAQEPPAGSLKQKASPFAILDALSATGLRALRYAKEIPFATNIIANDISAEAAKAIDLNIEHNNVQGIVHANVGDARAYMYSKVGNEHPAPSPSYVHRFDVIDLDPYGTAAPFLDSSLQALQDGGMLCVTCTDAGVFASNGYPEKAYALYGGTTLKGAHSHEGGLRLILQSIATTASKYGIAIEPLLSLSIDFYARLFIRIHKQPKDVKLLAGTSMIVYSCDFGCGAWTTQPIARNQLRQDRVGGMFYKHSFAQGPLTTPNCDHCGSKMHIGGPMWAGPLHNPYFIQRILDRLPSLDKETYATTDRLRGMLTVALEEDLTLESSNSTDTKEKTESQGDDSTEPDAQLIPRLPPDTIDVAPFFFLPTYLSKVVHCATPPEDPFRGAIRRLGYRVTRSHCKAGSFKTNAPWSVLWEIMREWVRTKSPIKDGAVKETSPGWKILAGTRGTERQLVGEIKTELKLKLERCETIDDMKTLIQSTMWRVEHDKVEVEPQPEPKSDTNGVEASTEVEDLQSNPPSIEKARRLSIVFDEQLGKEKARGKLVRYQINPRANWGPMNRAGGS